MAPLLVDICCRLPPGADDGAPDLATALDTACTESQRLFSRAKATR